MEVKEPTYQELKELVNILLKQVNELTVIAKRVDSLAIRVQELETELAFYKTPRNSGNSSVPPSKDENRVKRTSSLREKSGKQNGGQPGHEGNSLQMVEIADKVIAYKPNYCNCCGEDLSLVEATFTGKRQVFDVPPPVKPVVIQHETYSKKCPCGNIIEGHFPPFVTAPVQYGTRVESIVAYLSVRQYMPYRRICEYFTSVFQLHMSEGSVKNILERFAQKLYPAYQLIKTEIENAPIVGADETGVKINGKKGWIWVWQNNLNTFLTVSLNRGNKTINRIFSKGLPKSILGSDAWAPHLSTTCRGHQLCLAHMLRELNYFIELYPDNEWPKKIKALFKSAIKYKKSLSKEDFLSAMPQSQKIEEELDRLLKIPPNPKYKKITPFFKRLVKHRQSILTFLHHFDVSPDNNQSERAIRNVKVKQKISGQFKTMGGAEIFVIIRSVIDTLIKRNLNIFDSLVQLANIVLE